MSYTNKTTNYELPQWIGTDKPTFLEDMNGAYLAIDTAMKENAQAAAAAQSTADTNTASISTLDTQINGTGGIASQITEIAGDITTLTGNVNTINSLIGDGTPTTTAQTLIGAINELDSDLNGTGGTASKVSDLETAVNNLETAVNNLKNTEIVVATATHDGTKTNADLLTELYTAYEALTDKPAYSKLKLRVGNNLYSPIRADRLRFSSVSVGSSNFSATYLDAGATSTHRAVTISDAPALVVNDYGSNVSNDDFSLVI